jgi:hypothetical protein
VINFQEQRSDATEDVSCGESNLESSPHEKPSEDAAVHVPLLGLADDGVFQPRVSHQNTVPVGQRWHLTEDPPLLITKQWRI